MTSDDLSLYIHIPFCQHKCPYCDFNTYAGMQDFYAAYVEALTEEICRTGADEKRVIHTVFLGGGTPTVLPGELLARVLETCRASFRFAPDAEITSEANPGTVDQVRFRALRQLGVNRLSMGVQSFDPAELRFLGRIHSAEEAEAAFNAARTAGFDNINLDFIFGLPGQQERTWRTTLERALALGPEHLSLYALTVEAGTPLERWVARGRVALPDDDVAAALYEAACDMLGDAGYEQYEISNWARPGYACRHNLTYWRNRPYLGFGPGAHSSDEGRRWGNIRPVPEYIRRVRAGDSLIEFEETFDPVLQMGETMMLGLRLVQEGVSLSAFQDRFGRALTDVYSQEVDRLQRLGLLEMDARRVRLTPQARLLGNEVFAAFLP